MKQGEGANVKTKVSAEKFVVSNATVIRFKTPPEYRNNKVDIANGNVLLLHGAKSKIKGKNAGGIRAQVTHLAQKERRCWLILDQCDFEVEVGFFGYVHAGIEN
ncbi:MAG: hypothetical protein AB1780_02690 [Pseudomonadota bacterium]